MGKIIIYNISTFSNGGTGSGTATEAKQDTQIADFTGEDFAQEGGGNLAAISGKLPDTLGQGTKAESMTVTLSSDEDNVNVDVVTSALPTGAATEATLATIDTDTGNIATDTSVIAGDTTSIDGKTPALGQAVKASSVPVTLASDEDNLNVSLSAVSSTITVLSQLTAPAATALTDSSTSNKGTFQYVIAAIDTSVTVRFEATQDDTNWYNLDVNEVDTTKTANGTFAAKFTGRHKSVRFNFISEVGGTAATIDVDVNLGS